MVRIHSTESLRVPEQRSSSQGKSGPKPRRNSVGDGQQVEIPVLSCNRTVGTQAESVSREWKDRCKRGRSALGKSGAQSEDVTRTENK